jgi:hypothetical protein
VNPAIHWSSPAFVGQLVLAESDCASLCRGFALRWLLGCNPDFATKKRDRFETGGYASLMQRARSRFLLRLSAGAAELPVNSSGRYQ